MRVLQLIPSILITRFRDKSIPEIRAMGGITLENLSQSSGPGDLATWLAAHG